ncbi:hypothetical protein BDN72DRAFT_806305, partial [Pluteus cervinus]
MPPASTYPVLAQHFDTSEVAFQKIDEEIAALRESIRALSTFRNTFTPVYRLPPEILTRIFSFLGNSPVKNPSFIWIVATRVSQHWRNVALTSPGLWSHISSSYPKRIREELLDLSKAAPL